MRRNFPVLLGVALIVCVISACSGGNSSTPSSPAATNVAGNWAGTVASATSGNQAGTGAFHATFVQDESSLSGSWAVTYPDPANNNSGELTGIISGTSVTLTLSSTVPTACPFSATATLSGATAMSGTYSTFNCTVADGGPFNITKQ
jgi:hypothetical protein